MNTLKTTIIIALLSLMAFAGIPFSAYATNMWAETPNLVTERKEHEVYIDTESRFVSDFNPEMYAETPDLNPPSAAPRVIRVERILIAKEE